MDWPTILSQCRKIRDEFDKSFKCLNTDRPTKEDTVERHLRNLSLRLEEIRVVLNVHYERLTTAHKVAAEGFFVDVRNRLITVAARRGVEVKLPLTLHERVCLEILPEDTEVNSNDRKLPAIMSQTPVQFLNIASKLIPDFDGRAENLTAFLDALTLVDSIKESHDALAVNLIKTKLKGAARNLLTTENTIIEVVEKLKTSVKGESVNVLSAKLMNIRQMGKNTNAYAKEVEDMTKALEGAYISDGLPTEIAGKYSTQVAVKAIVRNAQNERVKMIIESGQFNNMNELMAKFVGSCTESYGQPNAVLYTQSQGHRNSYRGHNRGGYQANHQNSFNNRGRGNYQGYNNNRRYYDNRRRGNNRGSQYNGGNVRVINDHDIVPENRNQPLGQ